MVTRSDVANVAQLARLHLSEQEIERLVEELSNILSHVEALAGVPVNEVEAVGGVAEGSAPLRSDAPGADALAFPPEAMAPEWRDGFFTVPRLAALDADAGQTE